MYIQDLGVISQNYKVLLKGFKQKGLGSLLVDFSINLNRRSFNFGLQPS